MRLLSKLTKDYEEYLLRLIFGREISLSACATVAYGDFNRTLKGISKLANRDDLHAKAEKVLVDALAELKGRLKNRMSQSDFDSWHRRTCDGLVAVYGDRFTFHVGQAQKWINMTLKYIFTVGEEHIPGFSPGYALCHAPIDNIVLGELTRYGFDWPSKAWSQFDYDEYFKCEEWMREKFKPTPLLDVEFVLWTGLGN
ncbi:MAG TPA: hypothetical protein VNY51_03815 [Candidatus Dormibacteraeota bacterium]|jgi:hypothetical protein|nr:hypothetical protein [Candidatus Dormibacteraeota bacterium]